MFIPVVLRNLLHIGVVRNGCNKEFLAVIIYFTGIYSNLNLYVEHRGLKSQNKIDFRHIFRSMCLT